MDFYQNSTHYLALLTQHAQLSITSESVLSTWSYGQPQSPYTQLNLRWGNTGEASPVQSQSQTQIQSPMPMQMQGFGRNTFDTTVMGSPDKNEQLNAWSPPGQMQSSALSPPSAIMAGSWSTLETPPLIKHWFEASAQVAREHYEYNAGKHFDEASDLSRFCPHHGGLLSLVGAGCSVCEWIYFDVSSAWTSSTHRIGCVSRVGVGLLAPVSRIKGQHRGLV